MPVYDEARNEIVAELRRISGSKTFKKKTIQRELLTKYEAAIGESREEEFEAGLDFLKVEPTSDIDTLKKRRAALSESFRKYSKKEGKQSRLVLRLNDDDNQDVRLYFEVNDRQAANGKEMQAGEEKGRAADKKAFSGNTIVYDNVHVQKTLRNNFMFHVGFHITLALIWVLAVVLMRFAFNLSNFFSAIPFGLSITLFIYSVRLFRLHGAKFTFLFGKSFIKMTNQEIIIAKYAGKCPLCDNDIQLENAKWIRNIGRCQANPVQHRFTFDHETLRGELIA